MYSSSKSSGPEDFLLNIAISIKISRAVKSLAVDRTFILVLTFFQGHSRAKYVKFNQIEPLCYISLETNAQILTKLHD